MTGPIAYTDGSCLGNPGPGGWGIRLLYADGGVAEFGAAAPNTTNNQMELQAAIEALARLRQAPQATVYTDSRYVIDGLTKWLPNWRRRGWITSTGSAVKNRELWQELAQLAHPQVRWRHVRGHSGDPNNERVDDIARGFASGQAPRLYCGPAGAPADPVQPGSAAVSFAKPRYVSIVRGDVAMDDNWPACEARVRGVSGAKFKKVRSAEELAAFCAQHGVAAP